jgi:hypothetical protein
MRSVPRLQWRLVAKKFSLKQENIVANFQEIHSDKILGTIECFDRMIFRGYLPFYEGRQMENFLYGEGLLFKDLADFLKHHSEDVVNTAKTMAERLGRPYTYLNGGDLRKDDEARRIAEKDKIKDGLICVFSRVEPNRTFKLKYGEGKPRIDKHFGQCLTLYYYFMDKDYGLMHVRIGTWFPLDIQIYVNGHDWLARRLDKKGIGYVKDSNAFLSIDDFAKAQVESNEFTNFNHKQKFESYAQKINPLLGNVLGDRTYYWVTAQAEYSTDVIFKTTDGLKDFYPTLLEQSIIATSPEDVLHFLNRKKHGNFQGDVDSQMKDDERLAGVRIKHSMKRNRIKMYNKSGRVLRIETVINSPEEFKVRKVVTRNGRSSKQWVPLNKSISYLWRLSQISKEANKRYLNALAIVTDPTEALKGLDQISSPQKTETGKSVKPFSPLSKDAFMIFMAILSGEFHIQGFRNKELRLKLSALKEERTDKQFASWVSRLISRLRFFRLICKIPHSRKYKVSEFGRKIIQAAIESRKLFFPLEYSLA